MHDFIQQEQRCTIPQTGTNRCWQWFCRNVYKIMHKQCSTRKGTSAVESTFVPFGYVPKLAFGNVI